MSELPFFEGTDPVTGLTYEDMMKTEPFEVRMDLRMQRTFALPARSLLFHYYTEKVEQDDDFKPLTPQAFSQKHPERYAEASQILNAGLHHPAGWPDYEEFPPRFSDNEYGTYVCAIAAMRELVVNENNEVLFASVPHNERLAYLLIEARRELFIQHMTSVLGSMMQLAQCVREAARIRVIEPKDDTEAALLKKKQMLEGYAQNLLGPKMVQFGFLTSQEAYNFFAFYETYLQLDHTHPYLEKVYANRPGADTVLREIKPPRGTRAREQWFAKQQDDKNRRLMAAKSAVFIFFYLNHQYPAGSAEDSPTEAYQRNENRQYLLQRLGLSPELPYLNIFDVNEDFAVMFPEIARSVYSFNTPHILVRRG
jgi:hypothetical protein